MDRPPACHLPALERPRFDRLPLELRIYHIYAILPVDTLARCRAVSRHWQSVVDEALEKAHPYQRAFALRELLDASTGQSSRRTGQRQASTKHALPQHCLSMSSIAMGQHSISSIPAAARGFPLLSLDAWETAFYALGVPRQFTNWFRSVRLGILNGARTRPTNSKTALSTSSANSNSATTNNTNRNADSDRRHHTRNTDRSSPWKARALLEETEALCFLYRVCYGIASRARYTEVEDIQSGLCANYLRLAMDMYDRLHEAVDAMEVEMSNENQTSCDSSLGQSQQPVSSITQENYSTDTSSTVNSENTAADSEQQQQQQQSRRYEKSSFSTYGNTDISLVTTTLDWIDVLKQQQQRIFTEMLQLLAMAPRFLLRYPSFCFIFLSKLFSAFTMLPIVAARSLACVVHGIVALPDGVVTIKELDTLLTCLAGKEPLALSLLARHQLLLRYESLIGPEEANACRMDLDELRRLILDTTNDTTVPEASTIIDANVLTVKTTSENVDIVETGQVAATIAAPTPLGISIPLMAEDEDTAAKLLFDNEDNSPPSPTGSFASLASFSSPGSPILSNVTINRAPVANGSAEQRLIWLFEHVTALAVPQQPEIAQSPQRLHADAIMPFINEFEMLLSRCATTAMKSPVVN
ncbi:hypothetical protein BDF19DRAFT_183516 [Syncephalis fuscata]|nr:hypothetical protein BDF19DRAFT_183516 [Syncephalis fuscata]